MPSARIAHHESASLLGIVFLQLLPEALLQVLKGQLVLAHLELHLDWLAHELHLLSSAFAEKLVLKDLVDGGTRAGVEGHRYVEDVDDLLGHLREHLVEALLLAALQTSQVVLCVLV